MKGNLKQRFFAILLCIVMICTSISLSDIIDNNINAASSSTLAETYTYSYTGQVQTFTVPESGKYTIELGGGAGGDSGHGVYKGGYGGYVNVTMDLTAGQILYLYIGNRGVSMGWVDNHPGAQNATTSSGGAGYGSVCGGGGAASEIRLDGTNVANRLIVAGGGGGASSLNAGGNAGIAASGNNGDTTGKGSSTNNSFGGGGGGGYIGGSCGTSSSSSRGGSNYISSAIKNVEQNGTNTTRTAGYCTITKLSSYIVQINPNGGSFQGSQNIVTETLDTTYSTTQSFVYNGGVQEYVVPYTGYYYIEAWGAKGGDNEAAGGYGGYVKAYSYLEAGQKIYICCGGAGLSGVSGKGGGYNGGAHAGSSGASGGGGGATSITTTNRGVLANFASYKNEVLVVAGGGSGGSAASIGEGGTVLYTGDGITWPGTVANSASTSKLNGTFANGTYPGSKDGGGGGGGWVGGRNGLDAAGNPAGGGASFVNTAQGCIAIGLTANNNSGNGKAKISFMTDSVGLPDPIREGWTFTGWTKTGNGTYQYNNLAKQSMFTYAEGLTTLTANWSKNANNYTLTVNPNGGIYNNSLKNTQYTKAQNTKLTISNPVRDGYTFKGYTLSGGGSLSGTTYTFGSSDATLTAQWESNTTNITVVPNGGIYEGKTTNTVYTGQKYGNLLSISVPTRKGYTFSGWSITGLDAYMDTKGFHVGSANAVLTAEWNINQYKLTVKPNGGTWNNSTSNLTYTMDYNSTKSIATPTAPTGYVFTGWTLSGADSTMTSLTGASTFKMGTANATLTANYAEDIVDLDVNTIVNGVSYSSGFDGIIFDVYINGVLEKSGTKDFCVRDTYKYGYTYEIKNIKSPGYSFDTSSIVKGTLTADTIVTLKFTARTDTVYKVNHYQMNTDGSTYTLKETENLAGTTDTNVTPVVKTYTGFTSPSTQTVKIKGDGTTVVNYYYTRNKYTVTYIDVVNSITGTQFGKSTDSLYYGETATGATKGTDATDNKYYNGYYYSSCTTATVTTSGATVYRIFKLRTIDISGSVNWNDKSNSYDSRPSNVTVTLFKDGTKVDSVTGLTGKDNNTFSFTGLQKYDTSTGKAYVYTVSQSNVESQNNPEDKYTTDVDTTGFNFTNTLGNTTKENPDPEWVGFEVSGSIIWDDYEDQFGTRPSEVTITLYQNDVVIKTQVINKNTTGYSFVNLDKYDGDLNSYTYKVEETFTSKALTWNFTTKQYEEIDAYKIKVNGFDFTNTLVDTNERPIIPVKPDHINNLTIKLGFNKNINWSDIEKTSSEVTSFVILKQMETIINDGTVSYTSNYNGMEYNAVVDEAGGSINNIPSGKYEIVESNDNTFILEGIDLLTNSSISVVNENDKWYLIIAETNQNQTGTITLNLNADSFNGIDDSVAVSNLYSLGNTSTAQVMMLSMFSDEVTVPEYVEPITYTITYKDCDVVDDTKYLEDSETTLKNCEIEGFLGWSENSEATEPQYMAGDIITLEKNLILYPVIEAPESTEENSSEEIESKEQEETTETESTLEEEISEVDESTETVETETEEEVVSEEEESSEIEETTESEEIEIESSETIESEESLEESSAFSE